MCATVKCVKYKKIGGDFLEGSESEESSNVTIVLYKNETEQRSKVHVERHHGEEKNELEKIIWVWRVECEDLVSREPEKCEKYKKVGDFLEGVIVR